MNPPLYFDYAATTPLDARVAAAMQPWLGPRFGNAASAHELGMQARAAIEQARAAVAQLIGATPKEIVFTSGATESNNLAILGLARGLRSVRGPRAGEPGHLVSVRTEHKAVLDPLRQLQREGHALTWLDTDGDGRVSVEAIGAALRPDTVLLSIMHANNEIGVIQDIAAIGALCRARGVALHVDAAQSVGKLPVDVQAMQVDLLSVSAHKFYGPQGIGALFVRTPWRAMLQPLQFGGGQERGLRSGTLPVAQLVGLGAAANLAATQLALEPARLLALRERLHAGAVAAGGVTLNGARADRLPGVLSLSFCGVHGEALLRALPELALSASAACNADSDEPSYVLRALGLAPELAQATLRFSLGRFTTPAQVDTAVAALHRELPRLRALADFSAAADAAALRQGWVSGEAGTRDLGTQIRWLLQLEAGRVRAARFRAFAAAPVVRVCEMLAQRLPGLPPEAVRAFDPRQWLADCEVPAEQLGAVLIVQDALLRAVPVTATAEVTKNPVTARP